ncbi:hypothetical protein HNR39_004128 [Glaciimonas immobilis]|uniref:Uncharacterized protein n=1 Tax=Glaciimonas immobilis TaxID=728004 RepID=A0A840S048_9BURK|nr:hypothetical protein [Glaciimonas immobilis]
MFLLRFRNVFLKWINIVSANSDNGFNKVVLQPRCTSINGKSKYDDITG